MMIRFNLADANSDISFGFPASKTDCPGAATIAGGLGKEGQAWCAWKG